MAYISVKSLKTPTIKPPFEPKKPLMRSLSLLRKKLNARKIAPLRKLKETGDILKVLQPMHKTLWLLAPVPYDINKINGVFKATSVENRIVHYLVYFVTGIITVTMGIMNQSPDSLQTAVAQINIAATNVLFIALYVYKKGTIKILNKIAELDRQLTKLGYKIQYKFYIRLLRIVLVIEIVLRLTMKRLDYLNLSLIDNLHCLLYTFIGLITGFYFYYIIICIMLTNNMLKNLNAFLLYTSKNDSSKTRNSNIKLTRKMYSDFWHVIRCFNLNFNITIIIICGICFINSITAVYVSWQNYTPFTTSTMFQWIIIHLAKLIVLSLVCNTSKEEGEKLSDLLNKMYEKATNESKCEKTTIFQFLMQTMHEKIEYWACEMFPINKTFICSVVAVGTMNSILLLQLGVSNTQPHHYQTPS